MGPHTSSALTPLQSTVPPAAISTEPDQNDVSEMPLPSDPQTFFLGGIFALGVFFTLYVASTIVLPVMLAFVLKLLLQPAVRLLERAYIPRALGALLAILL